MKKRGRAFSVKAQGNSMYPILQDGDTVEYIQTPFHLVKLHDIILVYVHDILVTHRVIYKTKNIYITRGDNNSAADSRIQKGRVLAKVVRFKRRGVWYGIQDVYLTQSALYLHEIQKLETVLQFQKIPHVFLKGVLISLRYENAIPKRIYADCDVLVERINRHQVEKLFSQLGYRAIRQWNVSNTIIPEINFHKKINGVSVIFDLHFEPHFLSGILGVAVNFLYPFPKREQLTKKIVITAQNKKIHSNIYSLPYPSMQIIVLALHIFHHNYTDSIRYQLLDAVIRRGLPPSGFAQGKLSRNGIWSELTNTINEFRLEGYIYGVFLILKKYYKTPIPQSFFTAIRPSSFKFQVSSYIVEHVDIFSQDNRMKAGIKRFILIFLLSPEPFWKKTFLFIHPEVISVGARVVLNTWWNLYNRPKTQE